jgi:AP endonuclease-2
MLTSVFRCRPVGPGYDRGKAERLREEVNPQYKCNFFKWASDVRKESMRASTSRSQSRSQPKG